MRTLVTTAWLVAAAACAPEGDAATAREAEVANVLSRADDIALRARPSLVAGKYARMSSTVFDFYRGALPLFRHDWELGVASRSAFMGGVGPVWGLADPHPENFGILVAADNSAALEPNDFDSADRVPYLFDLRRLTAGLVLAARRGPTAATLDSLAIAAAAARGYLEALVSLSSGAPFERIDSRFNQHDPIVTDLFNRSARDLAARAELTGLTVLSNGRRHFVQGIIDPAEPTQTLEPLPPFARDALPLLLAALQADGELLDAAREHGSGVASWPRIRVLALMQGPTASNDDDVIVEIKELTESAVAGWYRPVLPAANTVERVGQAAHRAWAREDADPRFFAAQWLGLPVLVRTESEANKNIRVSRLTGNRATQAAYERFADLLGRLLARVHARSEVETINRIAARLAADSTGFVAEQAAFSDVYASQVFDDFAAFQRALERLGPTLGVTASPLETPPPFVTSLFEHQKP